MAILTTNQIEVVRQSLSRELTSVPYTKPQINAAIQAVEDVLSSLALRTTISDAIDAATAPLVLTPTQKRLLTRWVLSSRFERGNN